MRKCIVAGIFFLSVFSSAFPAAKKIDIDFTKMGKTMAYAMLYNICFDQEKYIGKTMRIKGSFFMTEGERDGAKFYSVIIYDATACCQIGLDFIPRGNKKYPIDFPKDMEEIEITGTYSVTNKYGFEYFYLDVEEMP